ncbi:MAG: hypothetical protein ACJAVK_002073, partial [Akkermansiaceae bacterium]
ANWKLGTTEPAPYSPGSNEDPQPSAFENDFNFPGISRAMTLATVVPQSVGGFTNIGVGGGNVGSLDVRTGGSMTFFRGGVFVGRSGGEGTITVSGGDLNVGIEAGPDGSEFNLLRVGDGVGSVGRVEVTSGNLVVAGATEAQVNGAASGVIEIKGGTLSTNIFGELGPLAKVIVSGGALVVRDEFYDLQVLINAGKVVAGTGYTLNAINNNGTRLELTAVEFGDTDSDGMADAWEDANFGDGIAPATAAELMIAEDNGDPDDGDAAETNADGDAFTDLQEFLAGSDPNSAASVPGDIDGDGMGDSWEVLYFGNLDASPLDDLDTDDGTAAGNPAPDGFNNLAESKANTDPFDASSFPTLGLISMNFGINGGLEVTDRAGIQSVSNWNNFTGVTNPTSSDLRDSLGASLAGMTLAVTGSNDTFNAGGSPDKKMMSGWLNNQAIINLTGIPYSTYDLIIYYDSWAFEAAGTNNIARYDLSSGGNAITSVWGVNQKDFRLEPDGALDYDEFTALTLEEARAQGSTAFDGDGDGGYHLIVPDLTASDLDIAAVNVEGTPASICAIQIRQAVSSAPTAITDISLDGDELTLTWNSIPGRSYVVKYSLDLMDWGGDLADGIEATDSTRTLTINLAGTELEGKSSAFLRVEEE